MNSEQNKNIEQAIGNLCENLVWSRAYHSALLSLHTIAKANPSTLDPYPQLISCLYHGLFDALFLRLYHFVDRTKGASGLPALFKLLRRYCEDDRALLVQIDHDERHIGEIADLKKIDNWRNQIVAHMTDSKRNTEFFSNNRLHLSEISTLIEIVENIIQHYSFRLLQRGSDTKPPSDAVATELALLMRSQFEKNTS
jgi:hypothetical protein